MLLSVTAYAFGLFSDLLLLFILFFVCFFIFFFSIGPLNCFFTRIALGMINIDTDCADKLTVFQIVEMILFGPNDKV